VKKGGGGNGWIDGWMDGWGQDGKGKTTGNCFLCVTLLFLILFLLVLFSIALLKWR
jgi:hypothetical protein